MAGITIPYKVKNSFFYIKESTLVRPSLAATPSQVHKPASITDEKSKPKDHAYFLRQLGRSIHNLGDH